MVSTLSSILFRQSSTLEVKFHFITFLFGFALFPLNFLLCLPFPPYLCLYLRLLGTGLWAYSSVQEISKESARHFIITMPCDISHLFCNCNFNGPFNTDEICNMPGGRSQIKLFSCVLKGCHGTLTMRHQLNGLRL